jgi:hypothetical protein
LKDCQRVRGIARAWILRAAFLSFSNAMCPAERMCAQLPEFRRLESGTRAVSTSFGLPAMHQRWTVNELRLNIRR